MAVSSLNEYRTLLGVSRDINNINIGTATVVAGRTYDMFRLILPAGANASTPVAPDRSTLGAVGQENAGAGLDNFILGARFNSLSPGVYIVCDRLSHQGGLSGNFVGQQTTNLPTAALTRYTDGEGVAVGLSIQTAIGTTASSAIIEYTNSLGVTGVSSVACTIGSASHNALNRFIQLPLAPGDTGVRSVEKFFLVSSTTTLGNISVVLYKPLYVICVEAMSGVMSGGFITGYTSGGIPKIENNACLFLIAVSTSTNPIGSGALLIGEA